MWNEKMEPKKQRFTIKKFTVGVASVLIGTTFALYSGGASASADTALDENATEEVTDATGSDTADDKKEVTLSSQITEDTDSADTKDQQNDTSAETASNSEDVSATTDQTTESNESATENTQNNATTTEETNSEKSAEDKNTNEEATTADSAVTTESTESSVTTASQDTTVNSEAQNSASENDTQSTPKQDVVSRAMTLAATNDTGATQSEEAPANGYSVTKGAKADYASGYNASNVPLDPNTSHYTVNSYVVTNDASRGEIGENARKGIGNRYAYSVSEADVEGTGRPTKFYVMKFDENNVVTKTLEIPTDAAGGTSYKIDDYAQVIVANTATGSKAFSIQKFTDDTNWFTPVYSVFDNQVNKGGANSQSLAIPQWVVETTTYKDQDGNELRPEYSQYGWQGSSFTTEPIAIDGYDVRATQDYVSGEYDQNIPAD